MFAAIMIYSKPMLFEISYSATKFDVMRQIIEIFLYYFYYSNMNGASQNPG